MGRRTPAALCAGLLIVGSALATASSAAAEPEGPVLPPPVYLFGPGHDDPGNVSWLTDVRIGGGFGGARLYTGEDATLRVFGTVDDELEVEALMNGGLGSDHLFRAPEGSTLTPGTYESTVLPDGIRPGPSERVDDIHERCSPHGAFEIKDITPELDRLWIVWSSGCRDGRNAPTGEIRFNVPGAAHVDAAPTTVDLQAAPVGGRTRPIPITLMNRSARDIRVTALEVAGDAAWTRRWSTCDVISAGDFCRVWVRFSPDRVGAHRATLSASTGTGPVSVPLRGAGVTAADSAQRPLRRASEEWESRDVAGSGAFGSVDAPRSTAWLMESERGMWVGAGRPHAFGPQDELGVFGNDGFLQTTADTSSSYFRGSFRAPRDEAWLPGTIARGVGNSSSESPNGGIRVEGDHRGCGSYQGDIRVEQADYDLFGSLERLLLTFRMNCAGRTQNLWGTVALDAEGPVPDPPGYPASSRINATYSTAGPPTDRSVKVSGRITTLGPSLPRGLVVERRTGRTAPWRQLTRLRTNREGRYSAAFRAPEGGQVRVRFPGAEAVAPSASSPRRLSGR